MKLQEELKDSGFIIVAAHSQDVPEDQVVKLVRSQKVNYVITNGARVPGDNGNTIPRAFLFDASGNLAGTGHPESLKQRIKDLVKSEPHFLAAGRKYTKLASVAESLKHTKAFGQVLKKIEKDLKGEGEAAEEAKYLTERIQGYGKKKLAEAKASETDDPFASQQLYTDLAAQWKGDAIGDQASARLKELKADKEFQTELAASQVYHQILAECDKLVFQGGKIDHEYGPNKKVSASVKGMVAQFKKKFSNSKSAAKIDKDLEAYNFKSL